MSRFFLFCSVFLSISIIYGCNKEESGDNIIYFVGDSQIANWDVESSFPNRITRNLGKDGAKLDYLKSINIPQENADIVFEIGTNDLNVNWDENQIKDYVGIFSKQIMSFSFNNKIYVLEVFPTSNIPKNNVIKIFNYELKRTLNLGNNVVIDVYDALEEDGIIKTDLTRDGLHLNDYGYRVITREIKRKL